MSSQPENLSVARKNERQWIESRGGRDVTVSDHPVRGERVEFLNEPIDPSTGPLTLKFYIGPGTEVGTHTHPKQTETITVNEGKICATVDGEERTLGVGDHVRVEPGISHGYENIGDDEAVLSVSMTPALAFKEFIIDEHALGDDDYPESGVNMSYAGLVASRHGPMIAPPIPSFLLPIVVWLLATVARLKGMKIPDEPLPRRESES